MSKIINNTKKNCKLNMKKIMFKICLKYISCCYSIGKADKNFVHVLFCFVFAILGRSPSGHLKLSSFCVSIVTVPGSWPSCFWSHECGFGSRSAGLCASLSTKPISLIRSSYLFHSQDYVMSCGGSFNKMLCHIDCKN